MDRLVIEKETKTEKETDEKKVILNENKKTLPINNYLNSFENLTVADIKKKEEDKRVEEFKSQKEDLIKEQYEKLAQEETVNEASQKIIEKPNYDFIKENKKIVKINKKEEKQKNRKKLTGIALACTLGISALICVTNTIIIDNLNTNLIEIDKTYDINLQKYLRNINNLDATKQGMEFIETYPEDLLDAGDLGKQSNWFDRLCSFLGGLFGG